MKDATWAQVQELSAAIAGFVSLHALKIFDDEGLLFGPLSLLDLMALPLLNLRCRGRFVVSTLDLLPLSYFTFINLTPFDFRIRGGREVFHISILLDLLKASPDIKDFILNIEGDSCRSRKFTPI